MTTSISTCVIHICGIWVTSHNEETLSCKKNFTFWFRNDSFTFWCTKIWAFDLKTVIAVIQAYIGVTLFHFLFCTSCVSYWSYQISCLTFDLRFSLSLSKHGSLLMVEDKCTSINCKWPFRIAAPPTALVELTFKLTERTVTNVAKKDKLSYRYYWMIFRYLIVPVK